MHRRHLFSLLAGALLLLGACAPEPVDAPTADIPSSTEREAQALVNGTLVTGQPVTGLSAATGAELLYTLDVPANQNGVTFTMSGASGNADMYVYFGSTPTPANAQCSSTTSGSTGSCTVASRLSSGTWYVLLKATSAFSGLSLTGTYSPLGTGTGVAKVLADNQVVKVAGAVGDWLLYTMEVPAQQSSLEVTTSGGTGDVDLYLRHGSAPTLATYDCRSRVVGTTEGCSVSYPKVGTWYLLVRGAATFSNVSLLGAAVAVPTLISVGQPQANITGAKGGSLYFTVKVPTGQSLLKVDLAGGTGDADLYLKRASAPSTATYACVSRGGTNTESCSVTNPQAGTYHILLYGYSAFSGATLLVTTTGGGPIGLPLTNAVPVELNSRDGGPFVYRLDVPPDTGSLTIEVSYIFSGRYWMYVRHGSEPAGGVYDCSEFGTGPEQCQFDKPQAGPWYVHIIPDSSFTGLDLVGTYGGRIETTALQNGQPTGPVTAGARDYLYYSLEVPPGQKRLAFWGTGGTGFPHAYARLGGIPTTTTAECASLFNWPCIIENPQPGTWFFWPESGSYYQGVSFTAEYTAAEPPPPEELRKGEPRTGIAGRPTEDRMFVFQVPPNQTRLRVSTTVGTGKTWLHAKRGSAPTSTSYDCSGYCDIERPEGGTWYIRLEGSSTYSDATLTADYTAPETTQDLGYGATVNNWPPRRYFKLEVPVGSTGLNAYTGGNSEAKLYVRQGRLPTSSDYDCASVKPGHVRQECSIPSPQPGDWFALLEFPSDYPQTSESFYWQHLERGPTSDLVDGVPVPVAGASKSFQTFRIQVPEGQAYLLTELLNARRTPKAAYAYQWLRHEASPASVFFDCGPASICDIPNPAPGTWYLTVQGGIYSSTGPTTEGFEGAVRFTTTGRDVRPLANDIQEWPFNGAKGATRHWRLEVPVGATDLLFQLSGAPYSGTGNADLYVKHGALADPSAYDCASTNSPGNEETCAITNPQPGTWYVAVRDQVGASVPVLRASYAMTPGEHLPALTSHVSLSGQKGPKYSQKQWKLEVPPGQATLWFATETGTGSVNLKVNRGGRAVDGATLDCATTGPGNLKQCTFANPQPGTWFVTLTGTEAYEFVTLTGGYFQADTVTPLANGIPATNLQFDAGKTQYFHLDVPANAAMYSFELRYDTTSTYEHFDVRVERGTLPTAASPRCAYLAKGSVRCTLENPAEGPWYARVLSATTSFSHVRVGAFHGPRLDQAPLLLNQDYFYGVSGSEGVVRTYKIVVPEGVDYFTVTTGYRTTGESGSYYGNLSLAVRKDAPPTATERDCAYPFPSPNSTCTIIDPEPGTYFVSLTLTANSYNLWVLPNFR
ncbi:pre-peptidase C-terminal domain-containing protein [Myxococcus sp. CA033]|uniref:PPC domain-containing protein n=1 Tax=Myxococcus sp. CA033 TaxID=2741516 RepID=UPI00157A88FC|nr:pre-peptidase C-terminal domain-containing protein [Myxococcus sp. CA033]